MASSPQGKRNIVFVHPDLGIGGAERLVIDAAVGLQSKGHKVTILTSHCDPTHCFEEARDGTLDVRVRGNKIFPPSLAGRFSILMAILRQIALVLSTALFSSELKTLDPDVFFVDQLSACAPLFRFCFPKAKVLFYGHFPDRLLAQEGSGFMKHVKALYRPPFDAIESWSTGCADAIVVNSKFTRAVFRHTFSGMKTRDLKVVYPCVDTDTKEPAEQTAELWPGKAVLLSINRFERKKNLDLALRAYAGLSSEERSKSKLVIAGGFDSRVQENSQTLDQLERLAGELKLKHATFRGSDSSIESDESEVLFLLSVPDQLKRRLLHKASILIYTPQNEHFGIVPIEAMLLGVPVLATNSGGPLETIYDGRTGWLRSPEKIDQWTDVMRKPLIPSSADSLKTMGEKGCERVLAEFSHTKMTDSLDDEIQRLCRSTARRPKITPDWLYALMFCTVVAVVGGIGMAYFMSYVAVPKAREHDAWLESRVNALATATTSNGRNEL
ncbi:Alpha-1,3-mannosyltransferase-like protein [Saxophila tyrrhenica]|uniref:Alpha-1,3/1,6-mannosyltransferase ALG2 n=1 Tax=Saxophila tyrrhenica TaxID=1690608 RepID=A0AAV9NZ75_9PEZI|nr:Alpha-1,3-mannosyltransferase-like protein [Saxophila tyrrhenica]